MSILDFERILSDNGLVGTESLAALAAEWARTRDCGRRNPTGGALAASGMYQIGHSRHPIRDENR